MVLSDSKGKFAVDTRTPSFVVRKKGYRSQLVQVAHSKLLRITLQRGPDVQAFPACRSARKYLYLDGWGSRFKFAETPNIEASREVADSDYGARAYFVKNTEGSSAIRHGAGFNWSNGLPLNQEIWRLTQYQEVSYSAGDRQILSARGQLSDGKKWRYLGMAGETVTYSNVDGATTKTLDQFLDGACLSSARR